MIDERRIIEAELAGAHGLDYEERPGFFPYAVKADEIVSALEKARSDATALKNSDNPATENDCSMAYPLPASAPTTRGDLREQLIEALGLSEGWEETAVHVADNVVCR